MQGRYLKFWEGWYRSIENASIDDEHKGMFFLKLLRFAFGGERPQFEQFEASIWLILEPIINSEMNKNKGGRPKKDQEKGFDIFPKTSFVEKTKTSFSEKEKEYGKRKEGGVDEFSQFE